MILYDLNFHESKERASIYLNENRNKIVRPYSKIQASVCDFSLNDELAAVSEPIKLFENKDSDNFYNDIKQADDFL